MRGAAPRPPPPARPPAPEANHATHPAPTFLSLSRARAPPPPPTRPPPSRPRQDLISPHFPSIEYEEGSFARSVCAACPEVVASGEPGAPLALTLSSLQGGAPAAAFPEGPLDAELEAHAAAAPLLELALVPGSPHAPPPTPPAPAAGGGGGRRGGGPPAHKGGGGGGAAAEGKSAVGDAKIDGSLDWRCPSCGHYNFCAAAGASGTGAGAHGRKTCLKCVAPRPPADYKPQPFTRLCVSHDGAASIAELTQWFSVYGKLKCTPNGPPHIRSFSFLEYVDPAHALKAQQSETGRRLPGGRFLVVMPAAERQERGGGGGGGSGGGGSHSAAERGGGGGGGGGRRRG